MDESEWVHELLFYMEASQDWCEYWLMGPAKDDPLEQAEYRGRLDVIKTIAAMARERLDPDFLADHDQMPAPHERCTQTNGVED